VILFDGVCNLCNASVRWVIARDRGAVFRFASLQSVAGMQVLAAAGAAAGAQDSVVLVDEAGVHTRSEAVLRIARRLGFPWSLAGTGRILPRAWRDAVYAWVARHRYAWFGRQDACLRPTPALRARFLDSDEPTPPPAGW
jgi:predicted DCC family thiol-disulfide oxidoreductase YuxK